MLGGDDLVYNYVINFCLFYIETLKPFSISRIHLTTPTNKLVSKSSKVMIMF